MEVPNFTIEHFQDHVGTDFTWQGSDPALHFILEEATPLAVRNLPQESRPPFRLMFRMADARVFPQHLYLLHHPSIGDVPIFLVPESQDAAGVRYCATFA